MHENVPLPTFHLPPSTVVGALALLLANLFSALQGMQEDPVEVFLGACISFKLSTSVLLQPFRDTSLNQSRSGNGPFFRSAC